MRGILEFLGEIFRAGSGYDAEHRAVALRLGVPPSNRRPCDVRAQGDVEAVHDAAEGFVEAGHERKNFWVDRLGNPGLG